MSDGDAASAAQPSLTGFYAARLDEVEAAAKAAQLRGPGPWAHEPSAEGRLPVGEDLFDSSGKAVAIVRGSYLADHLMRHDPARVLREVAAARADLADYEEAALHPFDLPEGVRDGRDQWEQERDDAVLGALEAVIERRAAVYSDHPDYRDEWKP